jgi:hypothetical protein
MALGIGARAALADTVHATWTANPASITEGQKTRFTLTLSSSPDTGKFQATSFQFNAGTSTASPAIGNLNLAGNSSSPASLYVDTTYFQDGAYMASIKGSGLVVKPAGNKFKTFDYKVDLSTRVNVANVTPTINLASLSFPALITEDESFTFGATAADPGIFDTLVYQWDFNRDGVFDAVGQNPTFNYADPGEYLGQVRVSDDDSYTFANFSVNVMAAPLPPSPGGGGVIITPTPVAVPLPAAIWGGLALCCFIGAARKVRDFRNDPA